MEWTSEWNLLYEVCLSRIVGLRDTRFLKECWSRESHWVRRDMINNLVKESAEQFNIGNNGKVPMVFLSAIYSKMTMKTIKGKRYHNVLEITK